MARERHYFTFGQVHMTNYSLPRGGRLADYWVTVDLPTDHPLSHRQVFVENFTKHYCPSPVQFAFEYDSDRFSPEYFPCGELCVVDEHGLRR